MCDIHVTLLKDATPIAKKEHHCEECGGKILKGSKYVYMTGIGDGFFQYKAHEDCAELASKIEDGDGCSLFGALREAYRNHEDWDITEEQRLEAWFLIKRSHTKTAISSTGSVRWIADA